MSIAKGDKKEFVIGTKNELQRQDMLQGISVESGGEFVLPDYMPKVQKVLRLSAKALPPSRFLGAKSAEMSGSVLHTLIYVGEDGEPYATVLPAKYEFSFPIENSGTLSKINAAVEVDNLTYRLSAPRKVNIRTKLYAKPIVYSYEEVGENEINVESVKGLNKLYGEVDSVEAKMLNSGEITLSDTLDIGSTEETKLLWCGAEAAVSDIRVSESGISVRGEACVKLLCDDKGKPKMYMKKIPFDEFLDSETEKNSFATATAKVISTEASIEEGGEALVDVVVAVEALVETPCKIKVVKDAFSENCEGRVEYGKIPYVKHIISRLSIYNVGGSLTKGAIGAGDIACVIDTAGEAKLDELSVKEGKITAEGRCPLNMIYTTQDEKIASADMLLPFKIQLDTDIPNDAEVTGEVSLLNARARVDKDSIVCDMEIAMCVSAREKGEEEYVCEIDYSSAKEYQKSSHPLCLIYPSGDSLWDISKKYHINPSSLAKVNSLEIDEKEYTSPKALENTKVLMVEM